MIIVIFFQGSRIGYISRQRFVLTAFGNFAGRAGKWQDKSSPRGYEIFKSDTEDRDWIMEGK